MPDRTVPAPVWRHAAFWAVLAFSALKTVKLPMPYAASHYLLSYEHGFVRRGLVGELLSTLGVAPGHGLISAIGCGLLLVCLVLIWRLSAGLIRSGSWLLFAACMVYAAGMAPVYLAGTIGYFDHLFVIFAALVVLIRGPGLQAAACLALGIAAILIHEASLLMALPATWFAVWIGGGRGRAAAIAAVHVALTWAVSRWGTVAPEIAAQMQAGAEARADFEVVPLLFEAVSSDPGGMAGDTLRTLTLVAHVDSVMIVAPSLVVLLALALAILRPAGRAAMAAAVAAALAPVALHALARDIHRWDAMAITAAFLVLVAAWRAMGRPVPGPALEGRLLPLMLAAIAVGAGSTTSLVSHQDVDWYPFFELRREVIDHLTGR